MQSFESFSWFQKKKKPNLPSATAFPSTIVLGWAPSMVVAWTPFSRPKPFKAMARRAREAKVDRLIARLRFRNLKSFTLAFSKKAKSQIVIKLISGVKPRLVPAHIHFQQPRRFEVPMAGCETLCVASSVSAKVARKVKQARPNRREDIRCRVQE